MKIKTSELTDTALDWVVAKALGYKDCIVAGRGAIRLRGVCPPNEDRASSMPLATKAALKKIADCETSGLFSGTQWWRPSKKWAQGGPIIERERIDVAFTEALDDFSAMGWYANMYDRMKDGTEGYTGDTFRCGGEGPTPLIAAMRCYVASKLGNEVDVPKELT